MKKHKYRCIKWKTCETDCIHKEPHFVNSKTTHAELCTVVGLCGAGNGLVKCVRMGGE